MDLLPYPAAAPRRLLVGFSGGRDSTALLHRLVAQRDAPWESVRAVHVHHGLHAEASAWADHCVAQAALLGVECERRCVDVHRAGRGLEDAARRARYAAFAAVRLNDECLVLAHHRDDQAETLLLALLRGSGERGLSAMRGYTVDARGPIWRPLLDTPAQAVADYAADHRLAWIDDPSNSDPRFTRNRVRHAVMPLLRQHWPQADASLAQSAALLAEADALLDVQARADVAPLLALHPEVLDLAGLLALPAARSRRALRYWGERCGAALTGDAIERVFGEWRRLAPGRALRHALGPHWLRQWQGRLWLTPRSADPPPPVPRPLPWDGSAPLRLGDGSLLALHGAGAFDRAMRVGVRAHARSGLRRNSRPEHALKALFAEIGVPPWQRDSVPVLLDGRGWVRAVADLAYDGDFDHWLRERGARLVWQPATSGG
jgi:tRNA(Ile)-lysidine synthase